MNIVVQGLLVYLAMTVTDVCWAYYINKVKDGSPFHSAKWAVFLYLTGCISMISVVTNPWFIIPAAMGAFSGTYLAVWLNSRNNTKES